MLLDTMSPEELTMEIHADFKKVCNSWLRISTEYDKERKKLKIDKHKSYNKYYEIKSKKNNNWLFLLSKAPSEKYKGLESINVCSLVYYYSVDGLRVFKIRPEGGLQVYNGHLFTRYNERLNLGIIKPLDSVKHFFINNGYSTTQVIKKESKEFIISVCKDGLLLGELQNNLGWLINKTFITKDLMRADQNREETSLLDSLQAQIEEALNQPEFDKNHYSYLADVFKGIKPS